MPLDEIEDRLARYEQEGYGAVEGWLQPAVLWALRVVANFHDEMSVSGDICEIGIHHGKFFLALENVARTGEECVAIDLFGDQSKNVDRSGMGDEATFLKHLKAYGRAPARVTIKSADSTSFEIRRYFANRATPIRLFSVDGGHTIQHVMSDMGLADNALSNGGVIFVDDWFNPAFPSVNEGLARYLDGSTGLAPIVSIGGKLLLSGISWHRRWLNVFKSSLKDADFRAKTVRFHGHDLWHVWK